MGQFQKVQIRVQVKIFKRRNVKGGSKGEWVVDKSGDERGQGWKRQEVRGKGLNENKQVGFMPWSYLYNKLLYNS